MGLPAMVGFWCNLLSLSIVGVVGLVYLRRRQFMPYHSVAVGQTWEQASPGYQALVLGLMHAVGGASLCIALLQLVLLLIPFRQGAAWAIWLVPISGLLFAATSLLAMRHVGRNTPAKPPTHLPMASGVLSIAALCVAPWAAHAFGA